MASGGNVETGGLHVLRNAHDLRIREVDASIVGRDRNSYTIVLSASDAQPAGSAPASQLVPNPLNSHSLERTQLVQGILRKFINYLQGWTECTEGNTLLYPVMEEHTSTTGRVFERSSIDLDGLSLVSFGGGADGDSSPIPCRPLPSKSEAYCHSMLVSGKGLACWQPRPRHPLQNGTGVVPGDVGTFSVDEGFRKIFNLWDDKAAIQTTATAQSCPMSYHIPDKVDNILYEEFYATGDTLVVGTTSTTLLEHGSCAVTGFEFLHVPHHRKGAVLALTSPASLEELLDRMVYFSLLAARTRRVLDSRVLCLSIRKRLSSYIYSRLSLSHAQLVHSELP